METTRTKTLDIVGHVYTLKICRLPQQPPADGDNVCVQGILSTEDMSEELWFSERLRTRFEAAGPEIDDATALLYESTPRFRLRLDGTSYPALFDRIETSLLACAKLLENMIRARHKALEDAEL